MYTSKVKVFTRGLYMYRIMDKEEIAISQIDNLKMVHIYDLSTAGGAVDKYSSKAGAGENHVPALAVYYGDNKQINLCVMDKHYNHLMERVLTLYSQTENKNLIIMDEPTKELLEHASKDVTCGVNSVARAGRKYMSMESDGIPRFNTEGYIRKTLIPMVRYYLKELYSLWDMELTFKAGESGWHGNVVIFGNTKSREIAFPVSISKAGEGIYSIAIGNFIEDMNTVKLEIKYTSQSVKIEFLSEDYQLVGDSRYDFSIAEPACITNINVSGNLVYCQNEPVEKLSKDEYDIVSKLFDFDMDNAHVFRLPWNSYFVHNAAVREASGIRHWDYDTGFLEVNEKTLFARQYSWSFVENTVTGVSIKTGGGLIERLIPNVDQGICQTLFLPVGYYSGWDYKEKLENRYFYEEIKENGDGVI